MKLGIHCYPKHRLWEVEEILGSRGIDVEFYHAERELSYEDLEDLDGIFGKESKQPVYETLKKAEKMDIETVNGYETHLMADNIPCSYRLLDSKFNIPEWSVEEPPTDKVVRKNISERMPSRAELLHDPEPRQGYVYQKYVDNPGWDRKSYIIDQGDKINTFGALQPSPLTEKPGDRTPIELSEKTERDIKIIGTLFDARVLSIDMIENEEKTYVVDVNSAPNPRGIQGIKKSLSDCLENVVKRAKRNS